MLIQVLISRFYNLNWNLSTQICLNEISGIDPTREQWKQVADVMERKKMIPFFDCAYQG